MNKKVLYPVLILAVGFGLAALMVANKPVVENEVYEPLITTIRVLKVASKSEYLVINSQGTVQPRNESALIPEVSGRVVWVSPSLVGGGSFEEGDILLRIDQADYESSLLKNKAVVQRSEVEQEYASDELKRIKKLFEKQLASQSQLDGADRTARVAVANLQEGWADLDQAQRDLARTELKAPFDGLVRNEHVDLGQFVSRGSSVGSIYATDYVEVRLPIAASQLMYFGLPASTRGQIPIDIQPPVTLTADMGDTRFIWEGLLVRAEAEIDRESRMLYGVVRLPSMRDEQSWPIPVGLFVQAEIRGRKVDNVVRLPRSALRDRNQVLVVDSDNRLHFRQIKILRLEHEDVLISDGLSDGELVTISPLQTVVDGMRVRPVIE